MGHFSKTGNLTHDAAVNLAEGARQVSVAAAGTGPSGAVAVRNAEIIFHRAVLSSCRLNNSSAGQEASISALKLLGVGGS